MRHEVGPTVCPAVENHDMVFQETGDSQIQTHSRPAECDNGQAIQARPYHPDRMFSHSRCLSVDMHQVPPTSDRSICYEVQQQTGSICVISTRPPCATIWIGPQTSSRTRGWFYLLQQRL